MCGVFATLLSFLAITTCGPGSDPPPGRIDVQPPDLVTTPDRRSAAPTCKVAVDGSPARRTISAIVTAGRQPQSGTFALEIEKKGVNVVRSRQRGEFALGAGESRRLAVMNINLGVGDTLSGTMSLTWGGGETRCAVR